MTRHRRARSTAKGREGELLEEAFEGQVVGLARIYGWARIFHAPRGGTAGRVHRIYPEAVGFPDLVLLRGPELVIAELKTARGRLGRGQPEWLEAWRTFAEAVTRASGHLAMVSDPSVALAPIPSVGVYLWRADDAGDWEEIQRVLGRGHERRRDLDPMHNPC